MDRARYTKFRTLPRTKIALPFILVILLVILGGASGFFWSDYRAVREERDALAARIEATFTALQRDQERAEKDASRLRELTGNLNRLEEYIASLGDAGAPCLGAPDTDRLRTLWESGPSPHSR